MIIVQLTTLKTAHTQEYMTEDDHRTYREHMLSALQLMSTSIYLYHIVSSINLTQIINIRCLNQTTHHPGNEVNK